jgi:hypothetical protein
MKIIRKSRQSAKAERPEHDTTAAPSIVRLGDIGDLVKGQQTEIYDSDFNAWKRF